MSLRQQNGDQILLQTGDALLQQDESAGGTNNLLADDVQSTSEVTSPAVGQEHDLAANDVQSTSELTTPAVGQEHSLLANDVQSTSEVSTPAVGQVHNLTATSIETTSQVDTPAVGQSHALLVTSVESSSEVGAPTVGQEHSLLADDVQSTSELTAPVLTENAAGVDNLLADDVESASQVSAPALGQVHALTATSIQATSEVTAPVLASGAVTITVQVTLQSATGSNRANLTNLSWAWFDDPDPNNYTTPVASGQTETTDADSLLNIDISGSVLTAGQFGTLVLASDDGLWWGAYTLEADGATVLRVFDVPTSGAGCIFVDPTGTPVTTTCKSVFDTPTIAQGCVFDSPDFVGDKPTNVNDAIRIATGGNTINDGLCTYFGKQPTETLQDAERRWLSEAPRNIPIGCWNDMWFQYLTGLGYTGALPDMFLQYWIDQS